MWARFKAATKGRGDTEKALYDGFVEARRRVVGAGTLGRTK